MHRSVLLVAVLVALVSCGGGDGGADARPTIDATPPVEPFFPEDFLAAGYEEVRNCRGSADHDLSQIRVLASPEARQPYLDRTDPIPDGAVILKPLYDFEDTECTGDILEYAAAIKDASAVATAGWHWQRVSVAREVITSDDSRCFGCHDDCTEPEGFDHTCAVAP